MDAAYMWFNFKTGEWVEGEIDYSAIFPQVPAAINLYKLLTIELEETPANAAMKVLSEMTGEELK